MIAGLMGLVVKNLRKNEMVGDGLTVKVEIWFENCVCGYSRLKQWDSYICRGFFEWFLINNSQI